MKVMKEVLKEKNEGGLVNILPSKLEGPDGAMHKGCGVSQAIYMGKNVRIFRSLVSDIV